MLFTAIDFETANRSRHSACALGLVQVRHGTILWKKSFLIRPPEKYFCFTHIHGIKWCHVKEEPTFDELWPSIEPVLSQSEFLVAHNAPFDRSVLLSTCRYYGITPPELRFECTVRLARNRLGIRPATLPDVCRALDIPLHSHHDPLSDALACARIMIHVSECGLFPCESP